MAVSGVDALGVWTEGDQIWFARRVGGVWLPAAAIPGASDAFGAEPALAAAPDDFYHLTWSAYSLVDDNYEIYYGRLLAAGWSLPEIVSGTEADSVEPALAVRADGTLMIAWSELEAEGPQIVAAVRQEGAAWSSGPVPDAEGAAPTVVSLGSDWHVAWSQVLEPDQSSEIIYSHRSATGWSLPEVVSDSQPVAAVSPSVALDASGMPALVWREGDTGIGYSRRSSSSGWALPQRHGAPSGATAGNPALAAFRAGFAIAWAAGVDVLLKLDVSGGASPPAPALTFSLGARGASIAADGDDLLVAAEGRNSTDPGDIYVVRTRPDDFPTATGTPSTATVTPTYPSATATSTATSTVGPPPPTETVTPATQSPSPTPTSQSATPPSPTPSSQSSPSASPSATRAPLANSVFLPAVQARRME